MTTNFPTPIRALAIGAHPDDIEFGAGGTLARWADDGCTISFAVLTDGSKGSWDPAQDPDELVRTRQQEQRAAAKAIRAKGGVHFLGWRDGELEAGLEQRREVARIIREVAPDIVLGHDPWKRYRLHPDHRNAGFLVTDGVVAARDPLFYPELGIEPHRPRAVLLWEADVPDHVEDIESSFERKLEALLEHRSQLFSTMGIPSGAGRSDEEVSAFRGRLRARAIEDASPVEFSLGEAFKRIEA